MAETLTKLLNVRSGPLPEQTPCCRGQARCAFFADEAQARAALSTVETRKLRRGYRSA